MKNPRVLMATLVYGSVEKAWEGRALHIANPLTLPFYLLPFYLLGTGRRTDLEEGNSHFGYWEEALHIANPLTLPFYLLPFYLLGTGRRTDLEERNSHFGYWGKSIAHCKSLDFTFLPFTFLPFEDREEDGGPGRGKLTFRLLRRGMSIAHCK